MNNISKSIGWADLSWNPIKGICPVGCWYCYAKSIYRRFHLDEIPWLDIAELNAMARTSVTGKRIFVCSTFDPFHRVADKWRDKIFDVIERRPDLTFIILTKLPQNIDRPMPKNVWLGVSAETHELAEGRFNILIGGVAGGMKCRFISYEPMLEQPDLSHYIPDWLIVGRLTGHGKERDPKIWQLMSIREQCIYYNIPLFEKDNLGPILGDKLVQQWPKEAHR
jgi:protein gp37